jgi:argininosuccinate lyase
MANKGKNSGRKPSEQSVGIRRGRFKKRMDPMFAAFNASIGFDKRLYEEDIQGSIAHARMLGSTRIIPKKDAQIIEKGLKEVLADLNAGRLSLSDELEDIHINIEEALRAKIGDVAGKLHTARSRNDQVALDLRLY